MLAACGALLGYARDDAERRTRRTCTGLRLRDRVRLRRARPRDAAQPRDHRDVARRRAGAHAVRLLDRCATSMGSRRLRHWLHHPLRDAAAVRARHVAVTALLDDPAVFSEPLRNCPIVERIAARIALASVRPRELAALRDALPRVASLAQLSLGRCAAAHRTGREPARFRTRCMRCWRVRSCRSPR